jgi:signal transduction histidine kinase/CheY-like chemotaxis protein
MTSSPGSPPRILVVDDSLPQLKLICLTLEREGYVVESAKNGAEALLLLETGPFDLVVSDCLMPILDGYQLCRLIKDDPALASVPVLLLTGTQDRLNRFWARTCGAEAFLLKGESMAQVPPTVRDLLSRSHHHSRITHAASMDPQKSLEAIQRRLARALEHRFLEVTLRNSVAALHSLLPGYDGPVWAYLEFLKDMIFPGALYLLAPSPTGPCCYLWSTAGLPPGVIQELEERIAAHPCAQGGLTWERRQSEGWGTAENLATVAFPLRLATQDLDGEWGFLTDPEEIKPILNLFQVAGEEFQRLFTSMVTVDYLADANRRLLRIELARGEFISTLSHEIRNPLSAAQSSLRMLGTRSGDSLGEDGRELVDIAQRNVDRLLRLANGVLDLERVESGQTHAERLSVAVGELAGGILQEIELRGRDKGIRTRLVDEQGARATADRDLLAQCLINLLSNALEHSPANGLITVTVTAADDTVSVRVEDQGAGVPAAFRKRIFQKFQQAEGPARGKGVGLGLAITKALANTMGGELSLLAEGSGAAFRLDLAKA